MHNYRRSAAAIAIESLERRFFLSGSPLARGTAKPTFQLPHIHGVAEVATSTPSGGISPSQMQTAYGVNAIRFGSIAGNGAGQTIAIIDAYNDPTAASDLASFDSFYGLPAPASFTQLNQSGGTALPSNAPLGGWGVEESLDVEWAHVIAPRASIILYEANSSSLSDLVNAAVVTAKGNASVSAISMSFGGGETSGETGLDSIFTSSHATFLAASGDSGWPGSYPAFSPNVIAVGGTTLAVASNGTYSSESGWSGSGGGTSSVEFEPGYQQSVQNTGSRTTPDVSIDADPNTGAPVYDSYDNGSSTPWITVGGTSLASPMWAGLIAIANQGRVADGLPVLSTVNDPAATSTTEALPLLYQAPKSYFHDITSGDNGNPAGGAGPGYDEVTGIGSPVANQLVPFLAGSTVPSWLASGSAATWNGSTNTLTVTGTATIISDPGASNPPMIVASGSGAVLNIQPSTSDVGVHLGGITLSNGATINMVSVGSARTHSDHNTLVIGTLGASSDPTISIDSTSKLNLEDNDLIVHTGSSDQGNGVPDSLGVPETNELGTVQALAARGRNVPAGSVLNGTWTGNGLSSSSAASVDSTAGFEQNVLAVVQNSDQVLGKLPAWAVGNFSEPLGSNDVLVKYTYNGDAALEGFVGANSVTIVNGFYDAGKSTQNDWAFGDFTGNGKVDDNDITILDGLYGNGTAASGLPQL